MSNMINETTTNRNTPFGDLPVGAVAVVMSVGELVLVRKEPYWKNGSRCTNARKLDGRRGMAFIWPDVLAQVEALPTPEETAAVEARYAAKETAQFVPLWECGKRLVAVGDGNGVTAVDPEWDYRQTVGEASYRQGAL